MFVHIFSAASKRPVHILGAHGNDNAELIFIGDSDHVLFVVKVVTMTTGPKISSYAIFMYWDTFLRTLGATKKRTARAVSLSSIH